MQRDHLHASVFMMQSAMGRTKSRIGQFQKNYEKHKVLKHVGRPRKKNLCTLTPLSPVETLILLFRHRYFTFRSTKQAVGDAESLT